MINLKTTILSSVDKYIQEHQKPGQRIGKYNSGSIYVSDVKNAVLYPKKTILNNKNIRINLNDGNKYVFFVNNKADDTNSLINVLSKALGPKFIVGKPKKKHIERRFDCRHFFDGRLVFVSIDRFIAARKDEYYDTFRCCDCRSRLYHSDSRSYCCNRALIFRGKFRLLLLYLRFFYSLNVIFM